jgi:hypothetical protein
MKYKMFVAPFAIGASALAGCVQRTPSDGAVVPSVELSENARWTASLKSVTQSRAEVAQTTRDRSYGTATWTHGEGPTLSKADIVFNYTGSERFLSWAIAAGNCGTPALPLIPMSNFPELQIAGGGRAQVTTSLPIELPTAGAYHVDVYRSRQQSTDALIACGNMKLVGR